MICENDPCKAQDGQALVELEQVLVL